MAKKKKPARVRRYASEQGQVHPWPKQPVVFMFQPTEYEVVPQDKMAEWEALMQERVGFPPEVVEAFRRRKINRRDGVETFSRTAGPGLMGLDD